MGKLRDKRIVMGKAERRTARDSVVGADGAVYQAFTPEQLEPLAITMEDFEQAVTKVQPSSKREGFTTVPGVYTYD